MTDAGASDGDVGRIAAERLAAQGLSGPPARRAVDVVERILAVQAQDARGMRLAIRSRSRGLHARDVDEALTVDRSLVVTWLNRGTLHLVRTEDYWWLHPLTTAPMSAQIRRRLEQEGVSAARAERGVEVVEQALAQDGPLVRAQLRERLDAAGVPTARQALVYILIVASVRGIIVRGPVVGAEQAYVLVRDWLGPPPRPWDRDAALAELAWRYLAGHGPAADRDLARWAGLPLGDARRGLGAIAQRLVAREDGLVDLRRRPAAPEPGDSDPAHLGSDFGATDSGSDSGGSGSGSGSGSGYGSADSGDPASGVEAMGADARRDPAEPSLGTRPPALPSPRLLGSFDPVLHGWVSRDWVVGEHRRVVTTNGIFRPVALVAGRVAGTWTMPAGRVALTPLAPIDPAAAAALRTEAADVERFLG